MTDSKALSGQCHSDQPLRVGEEIPTDGKRMTVVATRDGEVLVEFEHRGQICRAWVPVDDLERVN
jgi:hypothetical protein